MADPPGMQLTILLRRASQTADALLSQALVDFSPITARQYMLLQAIGTQTLRQVDLSARTGIDRSTMVELLGRMEKRGWVKRPYSRRDGRARLVRLTEIGMDVRSRAGEAARQADLRLAQLLGAQSAKFAHLLERIGDCNEFPPGDPPRIASRPVERSLG